MSFGTEETARIDALLARFDLMRYRERIVAQASPCVAVALVDPPSVPEPDLPPVPIGASKVGGEPDLPVGARWPESEQGRAGFFLQIALGDLPRGEWNPLPARGMVYLFCHDDQRTFYDPPGWELLWWDGAGTLARAPRRNDVIAEQLATQFFMESVARPLALRAATDFPPASPDDWSFLHELEREARASGDENVLDRYFEFHDLATDPGREADLARARGPFFHPIGRLLGYSDGDYQSKLPHAPEQARWRQFLRVESNPATGYMGPCDARPILVMAPDPGTRPWMPAGSVFGL